MLFLDTYYPIHTSLLLTLNEDVDDPEYPKSDE